jgi:hypothetical protein
MANTVKKKEAWVEFLDCKINELSEKGRALVNSVLDKDPRIDCIKKIKSFEDLKIEHQLILRQAESLKAHS